MTGVAGDVERAAIRCLLLKKRSIMINATFLTCISDLCRSRRIAAIASSTLDAWRAAIESIERVGGSEAECRAAVVLAFAIDPDLDKVRVSLGEDVAKLVTDLTPPVAKRDL